LHENYSNLDYTASQFEAFEVSPPGSTRSNPFNNGPVSPSSNNPNISIIAPPSYGEAVDAALPTYDEVMDFKQNSPRNAGDFFYKLHF
jgi:hypothetical protein